MEVVHAALRGSNQVTYTYWHCYGYSTTVLTAAPANPDLHKHHIMRHSRADKAAPAITSCQSLSRAWTRKAKHHCSVKVIL
jgi:hypothetical protein